MRQTRREAVVLNADVVNYCIHMAGDEPSTVRRLLDIRRLVAKLARRHTGRVVDAIGDNVMLEFRCSSHAFRCAQEMQVGVAQLLDFGGPERMRMRIGLHAGSVLAVGPSIFGDVVNVAARLQALAPPAGILLSSEVAEKLEPSLVPELAEVGSRKLRNTRAETTMLQTPGPR
jgi:adenylate cyclase